MRNLVRYDWMRDSSHSQSDELSVIFYRCRHRIDRSRASPAKWDERFPRTYMLFCWRGFYTYIYFGSRKVAGVSDDKMPMLKGRGDGFY